MKSNACLLPFDRPWQWRVAMALLLVSLAACGKSHSGSSGGDEPAFGSRAALGEALFSDTNLSQDRTQACATCHDPEHAFIDPRPDGGGHRAAVSLGDDGVSLGDRNAPTAAYAMFSPTFRFERRARAKPGIPAYDGYRGGQFHDGREDDLAGQASQPPLNPIEMALPDRAEAVARLQENADYVASFEDLFGNDVFDDVDRAYAAMAESIGQFEKTGVFATFDSKYDRSLRGEYTYDPLGKAILGKSLFFSQFTHCANCHELRPVGHRQETFTSYEYHNIGVPVNEAARAANGLGDTFVDDGQLANPPVVDPGERGKFKVPTLRNVAVTGPYMHNGVFRDLRTVIEFYDHFLPNSTHALNPETGQPWGDPEVAATVNLAELQAASRLRDDEIDALVCFLRTLTDARYESLIEDNGLDCGP